MNYTFSKALDQGSEATFVGTGDSSGRKARGGPDSGEQCSGDASHDDHADNR